MSKNNNNNTLHNRILVVDDEPDITTVFTLALADNGFEVDAFNDPIQALSGFRSGSYDLALIDGRHGFPQPFLDWYYAAQILKTGGYVIIDDLHIWVCETLANLLVEEPKPGHELAVPPQCSGANVEGDNRIGVEIVALSKVDGQVGRWVRDRDVQIAVLDIETETGPDGAATNRNLLRVLPCLVAGFTRPGHGVESPDRRPVGQTERAHPSLKIVLAAGGPDQHDAFQPRTARPVMSVR